MEPSLKPLDHQLPFKMRELTLSEICEALKQKWANLATFSANHKVKLQVSLSNARELKMKKPKADKTLKVKKEKPLKSVKLSKGLKLQDFLDL